MACFVASILTFTWRGGLVVGKPPPAQHLFTNDELICRSIVTGVFGLGILILISILVAMTIFSKPELPSNQQTTEPARQTVAPSACVDVKERRPS